MACQKKKEEIEENMVAEMTELPLDEATRGQRYPLDLISDGSQDKGPFSKPRSKKPLDFDIVI